VGNNKTRLFWCVGASLIMEDILKADIEQMMSLIDDYLAIGLYLCECGDREWQLLPLHELTGMRDFL